MAKYKIIPSSRTIVQSPISIGHKAEKGVEAIEFDLTAWVETYGSGTLTVIMRRWGDAIPYPIALEIDENNKATWTLSDIDTAKAGMAYAQLNYIVGDEVVKKSDIYTFRVMDSLTGEGEPPEAYESWLEHLTHLAAEAMAEVLDIEGIVTDKTLTVDGGIADAKATGDALALKADKSTTYTKVEVDQMIEDVEIETDTTLEVAGAAADAAETGRQIGLIKADLDAQTDAVGTLANLQTADKSSIVAAINETLTSASGVVLTTDFGKSVTIDNPSDIVGMTVKIEPSQAAGGAISGKSGVSITHTDGMETETIAISFPQSAGVVYGGVLDTAAKKLTVDRAVLDFSQLTWSTQALSTSTIFYVNMTAIPDIAVKGADEEGFFGIAENYEFVTYTALASSAAPQYTVAVRTSGALRLCVRTDGTTSVTPTGKAVLMLKEPIEYTIDTVTFEVYEGENTYTSDDDFSIAYKQELRGYVDAEIGAATEPLVEAADVIKDVSDEVRGASRTIEIANIKGLNFTNNGTAYASSSSYEVFWWAVKTGYKYTMAFEHDSKNYSIRPVFSALEPAAGVAGTQFSEQYTVRSAYTLEYAPETDGYIGIACYKGDTSTDLITVTESIVGLNDQIGMIVSLADKASVNSLKFAPRQKLYIAPESLSQSSNNVVMVQKTLVPYDAVKVDAHMPDGIVVWMTMQKTPYDTTAENTDYVGDGDVLTMPEGFELYKANFAYAEKEDDTYTLTDKQLLLADVIDLINDKKIVLTYNDNDIVTSHKDSEKLMRAVMGSGLPIIGHTSDTHADAIRYLRFLDYCDFVGAAMAVNSGDFVNNHVGDGYQYLLTGITEHPDLPTIICIGNHDAANTNASQKEKYYDPFDEAYDYNLSTAGVYFYKDFADQSLRVISLDLYEEKHNGSNCCISQAQIEWLISTLASTPAGYGVIIVEHATESYIQKDTDHAKFYRDGVEDSWVTKHAAVIGSPIAKIVDAFISGTTVSGTYDNTILTAVGESTTETVTIPYSADFTSLNTGVEFIAYLNGHAHVDMVGYIGNVTNKQLSLNITHGCASLYYDNQSDFPKAGGKGSVQDAFNLYVIDRTNKQVGIIRIGADKLYTLAPRDYMCIPYAD